MVSPPPFRFELSMCQPVRTDSLRGVRDKTDHRPGLALVLDGAGVAHVVDGTSPSAWRTGLCAPSQPTRYFASIIWDVPPSVFTRAATPDAVCEKL